MEALQSLKAGIEVKSGLDMEEKIEDVDWGEKVGQSIVEEGMVGIVMGNDDFDVGARERRTKEGPHERQGFKLDELVSGAAGHMLAATSNQAAEAVRRYGRIDLIRPYFEVDGKEVLRRLMLSLVPRSSPAMLEHVDLYGPVNLVFTTMALLLFEMKMSELVVEEGTLFGTSFGVVMAYWLLGALVLWSAGHLLLPQPFSAIQCLSLHGYGLTGYCVVLLLDTLLGAWAFFPCWIIFGGLSGWRLALPFHARAKTPQNALILAAGIMLMHLSFLVYLHVSYSTILERVDLVVEDVEALARGDS